MLKQFPVKKYKKLERKAALRKKIGPNNLNRIPKKFHNFFWLKKIHKK